MSSKFPSSDVPWLLRMGDEAEARSQWLLRMGDEAEALYPSLPASQARYRLGFEQTQAYGRTTIGGAVFQIFRTLGWRHSLPRIVRGLQSGTHWLSAQTRFLEDKTLEVAFEVLPEFRTALGQQPGIDPHFMNGSMDAIIALMGAPFHAGEYQPHLSSLQRAVYVLQPKE